MKLDDLIVFKLFAVGVGIERWADQRGFACRGTFQRRTTKSVVFSMRSRVGRVAVRDITSLAPNFSGRMALKVPKANNIQLFKDGYKVIPQWNIVP